MSKRLVDLTVLIAYSFMGDKNHKHAEHFFEKAEREKMQVSVVSTVALEAEALWMKTRQFLCRSLKGKGCEC